MPTTGDSTVQQDRPTVRWSVRLQRLRRPVQLVALGVFALAMVLAVRPGGGAWLQALLRSDPLVTLSAGLAGRAAVPGWLLALAFLAATLLLGRAWCGWLCPLGTLLDLLPARRLKPWEEPLPDGWRRLKYLLLTVILVMALLGSLTLLVLDPLTLLIRASAAVLWPFLNWLVTAVEQLLVQISALRPAVMSLDSWLRGSILRMEPAIHPLGLVAAFLLAVVLLLNAVRRRFWCRYLCPLGGLLGLVSRAAWLQRRVDPAQCLSCNRCARSCPTGTIDPERQFASDPAECIMCLDCVPTCRPVGVSFQGRWELAPSMPYDPSRRAMAAAAAGAAAGVALLGTTGGQRQLHPYGLHPPGATISGLLERCIRCGACVQACPTGGLQPALFEAGLEGLGTPLLVPRLGYCDFACQACGQVCPSGAIPALSLAEKQLAVIGQASIDRDRCLAWTGDQPCIVCEEVCPIADKAIWLETALRPAGDGTRQLFQLPHVDRSRCIGCGICEHQCPLAGPAAIRVWAASPLA